MAEPIGKTTYRWRPKRCRVCGRRDRKNCRISTRGLCTRCGMERIGTTHEQLRNQTGEIYDKYARRRAQGIARYAQRLLDNS